MAIEELRKYFIEGYKSKSDVPENQYLGVEYENFVVQQNVDMRLKDKFHPMPIDGESSVRTILSNLIDVAKKDDIIWQPVYDEECLVGLKNDKGQTITVEPGGQIELSDSPIHSLSEINQSLRTYLHHLSIATTDLNGQSLFMGLNPLFSLSDVPLINKSRYHIMYPYMEKVGTRGQYMMKLTSSTQVSVDYFSLEDLELKFVMINRLVSFLIAIFANSPLLEGNDSGYQSYRSYIWQNTDPYRAGLPLEFIEEKFSIDDYIQWALNASPYFLKRNDSLIPLAGTAFKKLLQGERDDIQITDEDWRFHLGMLFPEVRLKNIIEVRGLDMQLPEDLIAVPAIVKGLVYSKNGFEKVFNILMDLPKDDFGLYQIAAAKEGIHAEVNGLSFLRFTQQIMEIALENLGSDEENWLIPFFDKYTKNAKTPADNILENFKRLKGDVGKLADHYIRSF